MGCDRGVRTFDFKMYVFVIRSTQEHIIFKQIYLFKKYLMLPLLLPYVSYVRTKVLPYFKISK